MNAPAVLLSDRCASAKTFPWTYFSTIKGVFVVAVMLSGSKPSHLLTRIHFYLQITKLQFKTSSGQIHITGKAGQMAQNH